ncbi:MAG TPA: hypothetical protein VG963_22065, partial [Polyangiaceae bacterium]|nr:hypothetical protein [Polyangiaceae bacterium]
NWRGPIWFPVNFLIIESLQKFHHYYGDEFRVECPTGSRRYMSINDVANELATRLTRIFLADEQGKRPVFDHHPRMQSDPHFKDYVLFYEYFHGDSGRGVGAAHQTGWTGLVAKLLMPRYAHQADRSTLAEGMPHGYSRPLHPSPRAGDAEGAPAEAAARAEGARDRRELRHRARDRTGTR